MEMVRLARAIVGPHGPVEDLVHDAFTRTLLHWNSIDSSSGYLRNAVINACRSELRRRALRPRVGQLATSREMEPPDYLADALAQLPSRQRIAVVLRYYAQATEAEIGQALGCRPAAAGALLHRGLTRLRGSLSDHAAVSPSRGSSA
ncbi:MAG: sigma-70 family RNA polymerase sigma factor [Acidobacteria bacterium]|nr:sigma-70 family RNA polymerase sigma factor [Acidobacteriota bacterium]